MISINLSNIAILNIHDVDYCCIIGGNSKSEVINLKQNIDLSKKNRNIVNCKNLLSQIKMGREIWKFG